VTGIYRYKPENALSGKNGFPVFATCLEANHVHKREDAFAMGHITDQDKADIHRLAADPRLVDLMLRCHTCVCVCVCVCTCVCV
jgi:DNA replication licensing factor MCM2